MRWLVHGAAQISLSGLTLLLLLPTAWVLGVYLCGAADSLVRVQLCHFLVTLRESLPLSVK